MANITNLSGLWSEPIGRAFLAFGSIEYTVFLALRDIPVDKLQRATAKMPLSARIDLLVEVLEGRDGAPYATLSVALKRAKELAKTRNIIAHNPLVLEIYETGDGNYLTTEVIAVLHKDHKMTLTELNAFVAQAESLSSELHDCLAKVRPARLGS